MMFLFYISLWRSYKKPVYYLPSFLFHALDNMKINISWDVGLADCSLADKSFWIPIHQQYKMRISWIHSSVNNDKTHKY